MNITVTETAEDYLVELLSKQDVEGMAVRMFVTQPGTSYAETCLAYCKPDEIIEDDEIMELAKLRFYIENNSIPYLDEAHVDFAKDRMGGQLTIKAPNAKVPKVSPDSPIAEQINYILYSEVNPGLASHGGEVKLIEQQIEQDEELREAHLADQKRYVQLRWDKMAEQDRLRIDELGFTELFNSYGIGGIRHWDKVRCLHMQYAYHLATGGAEKAGSEIGGTAVGRLLDSKFALNELSLTI